MSLFTKALNILTKAHGSLKRSSSALIQALKEEHHNNQKHDIRSLVTKGVLHPRTAAKLMANALADQKRLRGYERTLFRRNFLRRYRVNRIGLIVPKAR